MDNPTGIVIGSLTFLMQAISTVVASQKMRTTHRLLTDSRVTWFELGYRGETGMALFSASLSDPQVAGHPQVIKLEKLDLSAEGLANIAYDLKEKFRLNQVITLE